MTRFIYIPSIASHGRCQNSSKSLKENVAGIYADTTRTQATSSNGFRPVPLGPDVDVPNHSIHGICFAICAKGVSEHATKYLPRFPQERRKHETRIEIPHCNGRVFPRVSQQRLLPKYCFVFTITSYRINPLLQ